MKKFLLIMTLAVSCVVFLTACSPSQGSAPSNSSAAGNTKTTSAADRAYHKITAQDAKKMIDEGGVTVVDVRTAEEYAQRHIPGALLLPNESIGNEPPAQLPDKDAVLLIYCRTGIRSKQASIKLEALGYRHIYDFGGIVDWPYPTQSGDEE